MINMVDFMVCEFHLHKEIFMYLFFFMYAVLHNDNKTPTQKGINYHIQDSELIQLFWSQAQPLGAPLPAKFTALHTSVHSWPRADHQHLLSMHWPQSTGFLVSFCKLGEVGRVSEMGEVITQQASLSWRRSNHISSPAANG